MITTLRFTVKYGCKSNCEAESLQPRELKIQIVFEQGCQLYSSSHIHIQFDLTCFSLKNLAKLASFSWHQTTKPRILFSPFVSTNFSQFEQLKKKTNFSLV